MVIGLGPTIDKTSTGNSASKALSRAKTVRAQAKVAKPKAKTTSSTIPTSGIVGGQGYAAPKTTKRDYSKDALGDSAYLADAAALKRALENYQKDDTQARERQGIDYGNALRNLGWNSGTGTWDVEDKGQGYGRATNAGRQNFAARGMLQGSGWSDALTNIDRDFNQQKTNTDLANEQYLMDADTALARYQVDNEEQRLASLNAAIERLKTKATSGLF